MKTSELYKNKEDCCGCELCAQVCPQSLIQMKADELGFLYPIIEDDTNCINCKKCIKSCPMNVDMLTDSRKRKNGTECILCCNCIKKCPKNALDLK